MITPRLPSVVDEFSNSMLGDERLDKRLVSICERVSASPSASFPKMVPSVAEREALYRFVENDRVEWSAILEPHFEATVARCQALEVVRVAHDTSWFTYDGDREGLGPVTKSKKRGFAGHYSLAVSADDRRAPLGTLATSTFVRPDKPLARTKKQRAANRKVTRDKDRQDKESARWLEGIQAAERRVGTGVTCIHVMDQEADDFALLADLVDENHRFVVRGSITRRLDNRGRQNVREAISQVRAKAFRTVPLSKRHNPRSHHPRREERDATLMIHGMAIELPRPEHAQHSRRKLALNVVHVFEPDPPQGEVPIEWTLYTTEPIKTAAELAAVVDHYRARWISEEFFKALKTGCAFEKRQLATYGSLLRALALLTPIAWHLLAIRTTARDSGDQPASRLLDDVQIELLRVLAPNSRIARKPTARDVMRAIADLGGHIHQNGEPGWQVLGRGYEDFVKAEIVWRAALARTKK